jgi:serine/threonine protein kinase
LPDLRIIPRDQIEILPDPIPEAFRGHFGKIQRARWSRIEVVLKSVRDCTTEVRLAHAMCAYSRRQAFENFREEIQHLGRVSNHTNIVRVFGISTDERTAETFIVQEFMEGRYACRVHD